MLKTRTIISTLLIVILTCPAFVIAYDDKITHPDISDKAISQSKMELYLSQNLGFANGLNSKLPSTEYDKTILFWLKKGSELEDAPMCRASNHFHNPLLEWGQSQLNDSSGFTGWAIHEWCVSQGWLDQNRKSAVTWATGLSTPYGQPSPRVNQDMGWDNARSYFYSALTSTANTDRETNFAKTFQAVGQVMHLLQDMAVPAHVRNDFLNSHVYTGGANPYELYVKLNQNLVSGLTDTQIITPAFTYPRPTDFWDAKLMPGVVTNISLQDKAGLAEYTNANFVSEGTLISDPSNTFPYPALSSVQTTTVDIPDPFVNGWTIPRTYYKKIQDWDSGYLLAGTGFMDFYQASPLGESVPPIPPLDKNVHDDYAKRLIPRAVGYSAGLLNYFFRGTLEITAPDQFVYAVSDGSVIPHQFTRIKAKVRNITPEEAAQVGIIQAVARYKMRTDYQPDLSSDPPTLSSSVTYSYSVSSPTTVTSLDSVAPTEFTFDFGSSPIPAGVTDLYLQVIFKGTLGNETDTAVAVGMKDINEPMHIVVWNATDRFYLDHVLRTADEIRGDPTLSARAAGQYIDPYDVTTKLAFTTTTSFPTAYQVTYSPLPYGRYGRVIVLTDAPFYMHVHRESTEPVDSLDNNWSVAGVVNQEIDGIFNNTQVYTFRTIIGHEWTAYARYYPDATGIESAPWPAPQDLSPYPATAINQ